MKTAARNNDAWIRSHFGMLVKRYGGKVPYLFVINGTVIPIKSGEDIVQIETRLRKKFGKAPTGMPVPNPQDFNAILKNS